MSVTLTELVGRYDPGRPLEQACTIPAEWYLDPRIADLELRTVFRRNWIAVAHVDALREAGQFVTLAVGDEPLVVVRGRDGAVRAFYNVCRHHAAEVVREPVGRAAALKCPYHGWTYGLDGALRGTPEFDGVAGFDRADHGLVPVTVETADPFVFVRLGEGGPALDEHLAGLPDLWQPLRLAELRFAERRNYDLDCNWKVFVDNYLDGGYHVPHIHGGLSGVLDYARYRIENGPRFCVQSSPIRPAGDVAETAAVRGGSTAQYFWLYPNFMINCYEGIMDTNLVLPLGVDRCRVIFDFYFGPSGPADAVLQQRSIVVADRIQQEDIDVCASVQRGLRSSAYDVGRLSVRREAGEHLFHRLLHADLSAGLS